MVNHVASIISLMFLSIYIMFSYELVCYQKSTNEALIETNHIVLSLQKNVNINNVIEENNYFDKIELNSLKKTSYVQYSLTTIKHYRCDINFFDFSNKDIITTVNFCSNI